MTGIFWIIFSYLLGSIPFGYLITRFSVKKNILEIGWRKTSGSNVFKNIGKWQGVLTGILDLLKGFLAVFGAQKLGFPLEIQVFSGVASVTGHNWSLFLRFAGGRGIGTFIGAFLALSPQILGFSLIPFILSALVWDAAIGTILFLITAIFLSFYPPPFLVGGQFETTGFFTILSLIPIFVKRLSPIKELSFKNLSLARNRLIFDDNQLNFSLRIKRIIKKTKNNPNSQKITKVIKPLAISILLPPKIGLKVAKYGLKVAKKPIQKLIFKSPEKIVTEIKVQDLKNIMIASAKKIVIHQEEINKINVWPIADKDTGYNLAATLIGVEGVVGQKEYNSIRELSRDIGEGAMVNARGNAGMIYTGYLIKVLDGIKHLNSIDALHLGLAMKRGTRAAYRSIHNPVEGTILDVIKSSGDKAYEIAKLKKEKNIIKILEEANKVSQIALKETKEKLEALKKADVVDAGALGFVKILEAWIESLKGITPALKNEIPVLEPKFEEEIKEKYEVISYFRRGEELDLEKLKNELSLSGSSLDVAEFEDKIKFHIHTNFPEKVRKKIKDLEILEWRSEEIKKPIPKSVKKKPLGLVVGQTADLPLEFLEKYQIEEVPFKSKFPDGEVLTRENLFIKMREAVKNKKPLPTTSQPTFEDFLSCYQRALEKFEKILVITLSAKLSGTYSTARIARSMLKEKKRLTVFDCFTAEVGEGLVAIKTQELISQGKKLEEILETLKEFCPKVKLFITIDDFKYIARSGRVHLPKFLAAPLSLIQKLRIKILIEVKNGKARFLGVRFSKDMVKVLAKEIKKLRRNKEIKVVIGQADNFKAAEELKRELEKETKVKVLFISQVSPVVGTYVGPGSLLVAFYSL